MNAITLVAGAYILATLILLHLTLLYCGGPHCIFPMEKPPVSPELGYQIRRAISALLPFEIKTLQIWAQWIIVGQIMVLILLTMRLFQKIICLAFSLAFAAGLTFGFVTYMSNADLIAKTVDLVVQNGFASHEEIANWTMRGSQMLRNITSSIK